MGSGKLPLSHTPVYAPNLNVQAFYHTAPALTAPLNSGSKVHTKHIRQISAGWSHSACLTANGDIHIWFPFREAYGLSLSPEEQLNQINSPNWEEVGGSGPDPRAMRWGKVGDIIETSPSIPPRPTFESDSRPKVGEETSWAELEALDNAWRAYEAKSSGKGKDEEEKVIKIASGSDFLVALRANGEVWFRHVGPDEPAEWIFVSTFLRSFAPDPGFSPVVMPGPLKYAVCLHLTQLPRLSGPGMTHITAQYLSITSYNATSMRHIRLPPPDTPFDPASISPTPLPALEGKRIIQIASGDYHDVALTEGGEVWTWGQGAHGQLGTGKIVTMQEEPERVVFPGEGLDDETHGQSSSENGGDVGNKGKRRFAFGITAAGWHTGALLLGDDPTSPITIATSGSTAPKFENNESATNDSVDLQNRVQNQRLGPGNIVYPDFVEPDPVPLNPRFPPIFRVGFAGRGSVIGNTARRNWQRRQRAPEDGEEGGEASRTQGGLREAGDESHGPDSDQQQQ